MTLRHGSDRDLRSVPHELGKIRKPMKVTACAVTVSNFLSIKNLQEKNLARQPPVDKTQVYSTVGPHTFKSDRELLVVGLLVSCGMVPGLNLIVLSRND
ncbi:MAG: hypothetical protein IPJ84_07565 [Bdellovibrionales bacterium]|nr:hypothetical protein [Bdellovibrionales bacterium]